MNTRRGMGENGRHSYSLLTQPVLVIVKMDVMGADCDDAAVTSMQENAFSSLNVFLIFAPHLKSTAPWMYYSAQFSGHLTTAHP